MNVKHLLFLLLGAVAMAFQACAGRPESPGSRPEAESNSGTVVDNPRSTVGMGLKGPVKTMTEAIFTANIWEETRYEFAPDGHLTTLVEDLTSCGDQRIVTFDAQGRVVDTTYRLEGCFDPDEVPAPLPEVVEPKRYTGDYSEVTDAYYVGAQFNDQGCMTHYHLNNGKDGLTMDFLYADDQTTLTRIAYDLVREDGASSLAFNITQYDDWGNPIQWPIVAPREPLSPEIVSMIDELIPALFVKRASYEYYK